MIARTSDAVRPASDTFMSQESVKSQRRFGGKFQFLCCCHSPPPEMCVLNLIPGFIYEAALPVLPFVFFPFIATPNTLSFQHISLKCLHLLIKHMLISVTAAPIAHLALSSALSGKSWGLVASGDCESFSPRQIIIIIIITTTTTTTQKPACDYCVKVSFNPIPQMTMREKWWLPQINYHSIWEVHLCIETAAPANKNCFHFWPTLNSLKTLRESL